MFNIELSKEVKKYFKKKPLNKKQKVRLEKISDIFRKNGTLGSMFKNHRLQGSMSDYYEFHLDDNMLVIWYKDGDTIILDCILNHDELTRISKAMEETDGQI